MKRMLACLTAMVLAASTFAIAEVKPSISADVGAYPGFKLPFLGGGVTLDLNTSNVVLRVRGFVSETNKDTYGDVFSVYAQTSVLVFPSRNRNFGFGGGATWSATTFRDGDGRHDAIRPFISIGRKYRDGSVDSLSFVLPGLDKRYQLYKLIGSTELFSSRHVDVVLEAGLMHIRNTAGNNRGISGETDILVKLHP